MEVACRRCPAAARLAADQHAGVGGGDTLHLLAQRAHRGALADQERVRFGLRAQPQVFAPQLVVLERALERDQELAQGHGFLDEVVGAEARGLDRGLHRTVPRHHYHRHVELAVLRPLLEQRDAVGVGHPDIEEHEIGPLAADRLARLRGVLRRHHTVVFVLEDLLYQPADVRFVVDDQDVARVQPFGRGGQAFHGRFTHDDPLPRNCRPAARAGVSSGTAGRAATSSSGRRMVT